MKLINSIDEYFELIKKLKKAGLRCLHDTITKEEAERYISLGRMKYISSDAGGYFLLDEESYYKIFLFVDLNCECAIEKTDKPVLFMSRYRKGKKSEIKNLLDKRLQNNGFVLKDTAFMIRFDLDTFKDKYEKQFEKAMRLLERLNYKVQIADYSHWEEIKALYESQNMMQYYHEKYRTEDEIRERFERNEFTCVTDQNGEIIAYGSAYEGGGYRYGDAVVVKDEYKMLGLPFIINYYGCSRRDNKVMVGSMLTHNENSIRYHRKLGWEFTDRYVDHWILE